MFSSLYVAGTDPDVEKLYPPVSFPVPKGTPMISSLIKWDHHEKWTTRKWDKSLTQSQTTMKIEPGAQESPDHYLLDHYIDGRHLFPATGYIFLIWKAFAEMKGQLMTRLPVAFQNVKIHRATIISETGKDSFRKLFYCRTITAFTRHTCLFSLLMKDRAKLIQPEIIVAILCILSDFLGVKWI